MKIALVHDQLQEFGGAERVLVALHNLFPNADVYTSFYNPRTLGNHAGKFKNWKIKTSWIAKIPFLNKIYSPLRFITPLLWETFDFSKYDLVISSSGSYMCKGVVTKKPTIHISYIHHPPRYLYGYETGTLNELRKYTVFKIYVAIVNHFLRMWDFTSSQRPDYIIVNSKETKKRVEKFYRRDSVVIYPPVKISPTAISYEPSAIGYYLTISRLQFAKHIDILIKAANKKKFPLKVVGTGRDEPYLRSIAGPTVEILGSVPDEKLAELYKNAKAFLFASRDEEFGIAPIEAMGRGIPVIALRSGGLIETIQEGGNGFLFDVLSEDSINTKIEKLEHLSQKEYSLLRDSTRKSAERYSEKVFDKKIREFINNKTTHARAT